MIEGYEKIISQGLSPKDFNEVVDKYLTTGKGLMEKFLDMGEDKIYSQQDVIQIIKKAFSRINYKLNKK